MKSTTFLTICSLLISLLSFGQTSTETFETESQEVTVLRIMELRLILFPIPLLLI